MCKGQKCRGYQAPIAEHSVHVGRIVTVCAPTCSSIMQTVHATHTQAVYTPKFITPHVILSLSKHPLPHPPICFFNPTLPLLPFHQPGTHFLIQWRSISWVPVTLVVDHTESLAPGLQWLPLLHCYWHSCGQCLRAAGKEGWEDKLRWQFGRMCRYVRGCEGRRMNGQEDVYV